MDHRKNLVDLGEMLGSEIIYDLDNPYHLRYTAELDHEIDGGLLAEAWERTKRVYPLIDAVLVFDRGDLDDYKSIKNEDRPSYCHDHMYLAAAEKGENVPVKTKVPVAPGTAAVGGRLVCISYYGNSVSLSAYHTLVDGGGMNMIFSTFLYAYLALYTGHEDPSPVVELREGREIAEYYTPSLFDLVYARDYTPMPIYALPRGCKGFRDPEMANEAGRLLAADLAVNAADFMALCKSSGANPSSMLCVLIAKATRDLYPEGWDSLAYNLTVSVRKAFGLENAISNSVSCAAACITREELEQETLAAVSQKVRRDLDSQRGWDYFASFYRVFDTYRYTPVFIPRTVTYIGGLNVGENNRHITGFSMAANGDCNLYLMQLNDRFHLCLEYGRATGKYLDAFVRVFSELGVRAEITRSQYEVDPDVEEPVL